MQVDWVNIITSLVSSVGFPIVVCVACFWYINKSDSQHENEIASLREAVENNTLAVTKLCERLGGELE